MRPRGASRVRRVSPVRRLALALDLALSLALALLLTLGAASTATARTTAPSVDAVIEPGEIALGDSARLTVTMTGDGEMSINLPSVPGLEMRVVGHSRQIQIV